MTAPIPPAAATVLVLDVDLTADVPCSQPDCDRPAVWAYQARCPQPTPHPWWPMCGPCHDQALRIWPRHPWYCPQHDLDLPNPPAQWRLL